MWDIALMHTPFAVRQSVELYETVNGLLLPCVER
jgi:hypothetical protein